MSTIRRQSIISSGIIYFGFALGFFNTYLFARYFTQAEYGLIGTFIAIANIMFSFANLGMVAYIHKFYPYYSDNLKPGENDMLTVALLICILGFILVVTGGIVFKDLVIRKFGEHSGDLVKYYYWTFPFGLGLTMYNLAEAFAWQLKKSILTNFLREIQFRILATVLILLLIAGALRNFDVFIKLYALTYLVLGLGLFAYLLLSRKAFLALRLSRVTRKFYKKISTLALLVWSGGLVYNISFFFAPIVIAAVVKDGLAYAGVFILAQNIASLIQAPQRGIIAASLGPLSRAWKDKDFQKINRIYHRSSINQLIFATGMFVLIWINFSDGVLSFHLQKGYLPARYVFLFIGLTRIVDMGTGVNSQIISTSTFWRFDFFTGIILLALTLPLNYLLTKEWGAIGPAVSDLIAFSIYNGIRYFFLLKKFNMQPFTLKSVYTVLLGLAGFLICHYLFHQYIGIRWIFLRSLVFLAFYVGAVIALNLSPDVLPVWESVKKRLGIGSGNGHGV
ncbi:MAG TPA: polysaccharide biosynthesis C-terminal domain-containing protein [Puia sp.]|nr:polysaccharide biosynthesis C-terminal domain-containing protein [Puia sp.]